MISSFQSLCILSGASCFRFAFFLAFKQDMKTADVDETKIRGVRLPFLDRDVEFSGESHRNSKGDNCCGILKWKHLIFITKYMFLMKIFIQIMGLALE